MIVAIHVSPFPGDVRQATLPIFRVAVPLFFLFSSYFLFKKILSEHSKAQQRRILRRYVVRTAILYLFWYVVLFLPTLSYRKDTYQAWFSQGIVPGSIHYVASVLFSSTFKASWYLPASIIGATIAFLLLDRRKLSILVAGFCFLLSCASSNYFGAMPDSILMVIRLFNKLGSPYNSFPIATFWMILGRELARNITSTSMVVLKRNSGPLLLCSLIGLALLFLERLAIVSSDISRADDCYISLPLTVIPLFLFIICQSELRIPERTSSFLRMSSTVTYCAHATLGFVIPEAFPSFTGAKLFLLVLLICWSLSALIALGENKPGLKLLKYSH